MPMVVAYRYGWIPCNRMQKTCLMFCCVPNNTPFPSNAEAKIPTTKKKLIKNYDLNAQIKTNIEKSKRNFTPFFRSASGTAIAGAPIYGWFKRLVCCCWRRFNMKCIENYHNNNRNLDCDFHGFFAGTNLCPKFDTFGSVFNFREIEGVIVSLWAIWCASEVFISFIKNCQLGKVWGTYSPKVVRCPGAADGACKQITFNSNVLRPIPLQTMYLNLPKNRRRNNGKFYISIQSTRNQFQLLLFLFVEIAWIWDLLAFAPIECLMRMNVAKWNIYKYPLDSIIGDRKGKKWNPLAIDIRQHRRVYNSFDVHHSISVPIPRHSSVCFSFSLQPFTNVIKRSININCVRRP